MSKRLLGELELNRIYQRDCVEGMRMLPDESVDLTVTSPPYDNLRTYKGYTFDFDSVARELYRVTKQGGVVVWVVGDATIKGSETGTSFRQALGFMDVGFRLHDTMIYQKAKIVPLDPKNHRYYQEFEYMFVLSKGKPKLGEYIKIPCKHAGKRAVASQTNPDGSPRNDRKIKNKDHVVNDSKIKGNVWLYANKSIKGHPAPFPESLARDHIISWSNPGDIVLDPFMGSGTTAKMAALNDRHYIGFEIAQEYVEIANQRLEALEDAQAEGHRQ